MKAVTIEWKGTALLIPVHALHRECWQANRDIFRASHFWRRVAEPFAGVGYDCLSGGDVERSAFMVDAQQSFQHDREFIELGGLAGLEPSLGTAHVGDTGG